MSGAGCSAGSKQSVGAISTRLEYESTQGWSAFYFPMLLVIAVAALLLLALRDRRAAGWLAVPAIWPSSQFHYSTMALPVMSPLLAVLLAIPDERAIAMWAQRLVPIAITLEVVRRLVTPWIAQRVMPRATAPGAST